MAKLIAVQLETCHANTDGTAWYAYFEGSITEEDVEKFQQIAIKKAVKEDGAPLGLDFGCVEHVPNALSRHTCLLRFHVGGAE